MHKMLYVFEDLSHEKRKVSAKYSGVGKAKEKPPGMAAEGCGRLPR